MTTVNIPYAKTHLSRLIKQAVEGEEIVIARADEPLVQQVVLDSARPQRRLGTAKGLFSVASDTGASQGIGDIIAERLVAAGAEVRVEAITSAGGRASALGADLARSPAARLTR